METSRNLKYYDELDDEGRFDWPGKYRKRLPKRKSLRVPMAIQQFVQSQDDGMKTFAFTYKAARFEEGWLLDSLGYFYEQHWISDVLRKIKSGKEASVYLCRPGEAAKSDDLIVKVYRPRQFRNLKNDGLYRVGRVDLDENGTVVGDDKRQKAIRKRSVYGEELRHQSWIAYEFQTLQTLYAAGADVPEPYEMANNAILMEYIGSNGFAAPTLNTVGLGSGEARPLLERVIRNIDLMLANNCIHGDLSAYNILYWEGKITLIDFPQVVSPDGNPLAWRIFERDVTRICDYFSEQGLLLSPRKLAAEIWTAHGHRLVREVHPRDLDPDRPEDRRIWERQK